MKIINKHLTEKWETIPVFINGTFVFMPIYPLRYKGDSNTLPPSYAFWGDPDNREKLSFVIGIGFNKEVGNFIPYSFIDPSTSSGAQQLEAIQEAELRAWDIPENAQLTSRNEKLSVEVEKLRKQLRKKGSC